MKRVSILWLYLLLHGYPSNAQTALIIYGSDWTYLDNGSDQGTAWRSLAFNDSSWKAGNGKFGYGTNGITTLLSYGPDPDQKHITTYFRKTIFLANPSNFTGFTAGVLRDDGIVMYVNGVEVYRNNMPSKVINHLTLAFDADDNGTEPQAFTINSSVFKSGNNIIAVEIHQKNTSNADMVFDLQLHGEGALTDEYAPFVAGIRRLSPATRYTNASTITFRTTFSEKVTGVDKTDFTITTVSGTAGGILADGSVTPADADGITYDVTISAVQGKGTMRLDLNRSGTGIADTAGNAISTGFTHGETYHIQQGAPVVVSITRQLPAYEKTSTTMVTFRVTFSEKVRGVDAADFIIFTPGNNVRGTLTRVSREAASSSLADAVSVASPDSTAWDVTIRAITGRGILRLDVKNSNTGITDAKGNYLLQGYNNGQIYIINSSRLQDFPSLTTVDPISTTTRTKETPQAKVWNHAGKWWTVLATAGGTKLLRLDNTNWTEVLTIADATNSRADCRVAGNLVHILLFRGTSLTSYFISLEYDPALNTYKPLAQNPQKVNISFEPGTITATLDMDTTGRIWIASNSFGNMLVRWSDPPYSTFSSPITIASGAASDDICTITALHGKIGVFWSNQNSRRFGFKTHQDGEDPSVWSADEAPAAQTALNAGRGMANDQLHIVAASNGTLYCTVKTGYNKPGLPSIVLLVRRPGNTWDDPYPVTSSREGNRPVVLLNEVQGKLKVIYSSHLDNFDGTRSGDILYRESSTSNIAFGPPGVLISGNGINHLEYCFSTHQTYDNAVLVMTADESVSPIRALGVLVTDYANFSPVINGDRNAIRWLVYPNPFTASTTVNFMLPLPGRYSVILFDGKGSRIRVVEEGWSEAGIYNSVSINDPRLAQGLYFVLIRTAGQTQALKLLKM